MTISSSTATCAISLQSTYKELKRYKSSIDTDTYNSLQSTYKELKHGIIEAFDEALNKFIVYL